MARVRHAGHTGSPARIARLLSVLADRTRLRILALLNAGDRCVCEIHQSLRLPQPTVSRHLAQLRRAGLVATRKDGLWVHYRLARRRADGLWSLLEAVEARVATSPEGREDRSKIEALPVCCEHARATIESDALRETDVHGTHATRSRR